MTHTMTHLTALIERLERASGPDRGLDAEIARVVGTEVKRAYPTSAGRDWLEPARIAGGWNWLRRFTASIDDALTLVPPETFYLIGKGKTRPDEPMFGAQILATTNEVTLGQGEHDTSPALAVCIAVLRMGLAVHQASSPNNPDPPRPLATAAS